MDQRLTSREKRLGHLAAALLLAAIPGAFAVSPLRAQDVPTDGAAREVWEREVAFARTMADRDLDAFASFLSDEAVFFAGARPLRGRAAILEAWAPFFQGPDAPFSWAPDLVEVLASGDLALTSGTVTSPSGEAAGRFNTVWRQDADGVWRVVFDKGS